MYLLIHLTEVRLNRFHLSIITANIWRVFIHLNYSIARFCAPPWHLCLFILFACFPTSACRSKSLRKKKHKELTWTTMSSMLQAYREECQQFHFCLLFASSHNLYNLIFFTFFCFYLLYKSQWNFILGSYALAMSMVALISFYVNRRWKIK